MNLVRHLFYAGLTKEDYGAVADNVIEENDKQLTIYSTITLAILAVLSLVSREASSFGGRNRTIYICSALVCGVIAWLSIYMTAKYPRSVPILVTVYEIVLYILGIAVSLIHAELPGVSEIAFLLIVPILFIDRPILAAVKTAAAATAFCIVTRMVKSPEVATVDVYNSMVYSVAAIMIGLFITELKMHSLIQKERITYLSKMDMLTGVHNRNSFEETVKRLPELCKKTVTCIYGDVNGLHELNNTKGHAAGDQMLQAVAASLRKHFGAEHLYRIGGDEFVVIRIDRPPLSNEIECVLSEIGAWDYHMSFGIRTMTREELDSAVLIRQAEEAMYREKENYYRSTGKAAR